MTTAANLLRFSGQQGLTANAFIRDSDGAIADPLTQTFRTYDGDDFDDYKTAVPEQGNSGFYSTPFPSWIQPGEYHITYQAEQGGGIALPSDQVIFQVVKTWDGTTIVDELSVGTSKAAICNMAIGHLGISRPAISNLTTDTSDESTALRTYYDTALRKALRDFTWPFATRIGALALVEEDPNDDWKYAYRYPANCTEIRRVLGSGRFESAGSRTPWRIVGDDAGQLILVDTEDAEVEYGALVTNPNRYPPDFILAFSYLLAHYVAPLLTKGDPYGLRKDMLSFYMAEISTARANAFNEAQPDVKPDADIISERNA